MIISLDTETTGIDLRHGAKPYLVTTCNEDGECTWWEWDVDPLTREPIIPVDDLYAIQKVITEADRIFLQNPKFDVLALRAIFDGKKGRPKLWWDWSKVFDTLLAGHLLASNQPHDLTTMALIYLKVNIQPLEDAIEVAVKEALKLVRRKANKDAFGDWRIAKAGLPEMPSAKEKTWKYDMWLPRAVAKRLKYPKDHPWQYLCTEYANGDSSVTLPLGQEQEQLIKERKLWSIYQERLKLLPILEHMESRGVTLSKDRKDELTARLTEEAERCRRVCINVADREIEDLPVNGVSNALKYVIFDKFGLKSNKKTKKGNDSMDKYVLEHWLATLPERSKPYVFVKNLRDYRKRKTALGYMASYEKYWLPLSDGTYVVYPSLNPTGTDTLRFSSSNPNEQQISKQDEVNLRYCFGPAPGREWWSLDYENIELRIPAYESGEEAMIEIFEKPDEPPYFGSYHLMNASIIHPELFWPLAEQKGAFKEKYKSTWYQWTKNFGFAISYGAIEQSGTADRAAHKPGAQRMVMDRLKEHTRLNQQMIGYANKHGYVETIPDKTVDPERGYPLLCTRTRWGTVSPTVPLNYHVQSTAMWCTMKAMIRCHEYLKGIPDHHIILQVHDEIVFDFPAGGKKNLGKINKIRRLMEQSGDDIGIPLRVSVSYHPNNWSEEEEP